MLADAHAHANRWSSVSPDAKASFSALALVAAFLAPPFVALGLAVVLAAAAVVGARVPVRSYGRVASVPASFLLLSAATISLSVAPVATAPWLALSVEPAQLTRAAALVARSSAALSAMLLLALTTPMTDLIALARRLRVPVTLVELMSVCYRALFVLSETAHDTRRAQAARLGYSSFSASVRSMGASVATLLVETWRRSLVMHQASVARCGGGDLRFLERGHPARRIEITLAIACGAALVAAAALARFGGVA